MISELIPVASTSEETEEPNEVLLYLVRHGETDLNDDNKFRGWLDVGLNEKGESEAHQAAKFLKGKGVVVVVSSDLNRAAETGKAIARDLKVSVHFDAALRSVNVGDLAGEERTKENLDTVEECLEDPELELPGGESFQQFRERWLAALDLYLDLAKHFGPLVLVTHTRNLMAAAEKFGDGDSSEELTDLVKPGGVAEITRDGLLRAVYKPSTYSEGKAVS